MRAIQLDTVSLAVDAAAASLLKLRLEPTTDAQRDALDRLARWNGDLARRLARGRAVPRAWISAIMRRLFGDRIGEDLFAAYQGFREIFVAGTLPDDARAQPDRVDPEALRAALDDAIEEVAGRTWGELHALVLAHPLARIPGLDEVFTAATIPLGGDEPDDRPGRVGPAARLPPGGDPVVSARSGTWATSSGASASCRAGSAATPPRPTGPIRRRSSRPAARSPPGFDEPAAATLLIAPG